MIVKVDFGIEKGKIRKLHGVGQPPFIGTDYSMMDYLSEAGIPFSRLHDVAGPYGGNRYVDIPNIFRDFDADPYDPESYDFTFTDHLMEQIVARGIEPFYRLGVTIENYAYIKAYRIYPPKDPKKWAVICEHVIRHYNEGWANGYNYGIKYWEIWNEPENHVDMIRNEMWRGTKEEYFELYDVASKHLKACFPEIKVGGYASCGAYAILADKTDKGDTPERKAYWIEFFDAFMKYVKENSCPLDFFSWHSYDNVECTKVYAKYFRDELDKWGFAEAETSCNEWNPCPELKGTNRQASETIAMMLAFQNLPVDTAMFYDAGLGISIYRPLFDPMTNKPFPTYYAFKAFNELYKLGCEVKCECSVDKGVYALAAAADGRGVIVVSNTTAAEQSLELDLSEGRVTKCIMTAEGINYGEVDLPKEMPPYSFAVIEIAI